MSRIGISSLFVRHGRVGGAESMLDNLLLGLADIRRPNDDLIVFHDGRSLPSMHVAGARYKPIPGPRFANRFVDEALTLPWYTRDVDALLFPNYFTPPLTTARRVVTVIHDLQYRHLPQHFSGRKRAWLRVAHEVTLRRADAVVTLTEFVRNDILESYGQRYADRLHVIPNPISWERYGGPDGGQPRGEPYILSVAAHYPHKNLATLIDAFAAVRRQHPRHRLVLVGQLSQHLAGGVPQVDLPWRIRELGLQDAVSVTGFVTDAELGAWYRGADLFVFPSLFEGFGMPPVEALGFGIPTLTTACEPLRSVTLGLAQYVASPRSADAFAGHMGEMLDRRSAYVPTEDQVAQIRRFYAPARIAERYYRLLVDGRSE